MSIVSIRRQEKQVAVESDPGANEREARRRPRNDWGKILSVAAAAFVALAGLLPTLNAGWEGAGAALVTAAALGAAGVALVVSALAHWGPNSAAESSADGEAVANAGPWRWARFAVGGALAATVVVAGALMPLTPDRTVSSAEDSSDPTGEAAVHNREDQEQGFPEAASDEDNRRLADDEWPPNEVDDEGSEEVSEESEIECAPVAAASTGDVADMLNTDRIRPGVQLAWLQREALPVLPLSVSQGDGFTQLTYAGPAWVVIVLVNCDEAVLAYTVTTSDPEAFSPQLSNCFGVQEELGALTLPVLHRRDLVWLQPGGANTPPAYAEIRTLATADACPGTLAVLLGSVVAVSLGFGSWEVPGEVDGYSPIDSAQEGLVALDEAAGSPPPVCARATTYGEFAVDPRDLPVGNLIPFWLGVGEITDGGVPESYGAGMC